MEIFLTFRNADMTEGRGPMVPDEAFLHKKHAEEYIDAQCGVMGRRLRWSKGEGGDWVIEKLVVNEASLIDAQKERERLRQQALAKLTPYERTLLGLEA